MLNILIIAIKIIVLLGFLILIHESGHFLVAKMCKVRVNEFSIGFGPIIWKKQGKETKYEIRLIPLGGFVSMEGEEERSDKEGSFSNASIPKRIAIAVAGATVNIIFGLCVYFVIAFTSKMYLTKGYQYVENGFLDRCIFACVQTKELIAQIGVGLSQIFTGKAGVDQMMGPVGISGVIAQTSGIREFMLMMALISVSLGVTNLLPIPALDGGRILILIIEAIRRKPMKQETEINIQLLGFALLISLSLVVTYNDILRFF